MNVYDFDKTIYDGDSTFHFLMFCAKRNPKVLFKLPRIAVRGILFLCGAVKKQAFKEDMFSFLSVIDTDRELEAFWSRNISGIKQWYKENQHEDDLVITASPEFLVEYATRMIGIKYIMGSPVDKHTGKYTGNNCHGKEKVARFNAAYPGARIEGFYSDSYSDSPLANISEKAFLVKGNKLLPWDMERSKKHI